MERFFSDERETSPKGNCRGAGKTSRFYSKLASIISQHENEKKKINLIVIFTFYFRVSLFFRINFHFQPPKNGRKCLRKNQIS